MDGHVVGGRAHDVDVDVLRAAFDLEVARQLGDHVGHVAGVVGERRVIIHREAHADVARDPAHEALARKDRQQGGAERLDPVLDGLLGARTERDHGDHRPDTDDDAQHGEQRAELVGPDRLKRDLDDLAEQHRYRGLPDRVVGGVTGVCWRKPGSPPPVMFWKRLRKSCCACTSEAEGRTSTVSLSVSPLVTSM